MQSTSELTMSGSIKVLKIDGRTMMALLRADIKTIADLTSKCYCDLMEVKFIGTGRVFSIIDALDTHDLKLNQCRSSRRQG